MPKFIDIDTHPFTKAQLRFFRRELEKAGGAKELMIEKEAWTKKNGSWEIGNFKNIEEYKEKYLTGVYEPLREYYNTEVPYFFWSNLYEMLRMVNPRIK